MENVRVKNINTLTHLHEARAYSRAEYPGGGGGLSLMLYYYVA
jgi:hypothetical protein